MGLLISLIIFFALATGVEAYIIVTQFKREDKLITIANSAVADLEEIGRLIQDSEELIENPKLKEAFAHDDEVGGYFKNLESMQEILKSYLDNEQGI